MGKKSPTKGRRARGTGTIFPKPGGGWIGRKTVGGHRVERHGDTQGEVVAKLEAATPPTKGGTVAQWAAAWRAGWDVRPRTRKNYANYLDTHILPLLGRDKLAAITPNAVERFAARLKANGLAPNTVRGVVRVLGTMLRAAARDGLIPGNPVAVAKKPRAARTEIDPFTPAELRRVVAACREPRLAAVALMAATGCRVGEATGLDVPDYDPAAGTVAITRTFTDGQLGPPKTLNSVRTIRVPEAARPALLAARGARESGPLFLTAAGGRRNTGVLTKGYRRLLRRLGLRYRNPHQLRHSVATAMIGAGAPIPDVAAYLGDTKESIVATYLHRTGADPSLAMDRLLAAGG